MTPLDLAGIIERDREAGDSLVGVGWTLAEWHANGVIALDDRRALLALLREMREALAEVGRWIDGMDTVSVEWAPAHSAPFVSKLVLRPGIEAIFSRHLPALAALAEP